MRKLVDLDYALHIKTKDGKEYNSITIGPYLGNETIIFSIPIYESGKIYPINEFDELKDYNNFQFLEIHNLDEFMQILKGQKVKVISVGNSISYNNSNVKEIYISCKL